MKEYRIKLLKNGETLKLRIRYEEFQDIEMVLREYEDYIETCPTKSWKARKKYTE